MKRATVMLTEVDFKIYISIHALVKRATTAPNGRCTSPVISIHALVKRATAVYQRIDYLASISIHALVKRATNRQ